ncbi:MAG: EFR1 family ferrodoxin [bacterium]
MSTEKQGHYQILYFSGTGNSEYAALQLRDKLLADGNICDMHAVDVLWAAAHRAPGIFGDENLLSARLGDLLKDAAVLVLVYPTYASDIPEPMKEVIPLLPDVKDVGLVVVSTVHAAGGDCCALPLRELEKKGYQPLFAGYIKMPNNFKLPPLPFPSIKNGDDLKKYFSSVAKEIDFILDKLASGQKYIQGAGLFSCILGVFQRSGEKFLARYLYKNMFADETCIKCGLCAASCPMGNITFDKERPKFADNCCFCLRCYHGCPVSAIQVTAKSKNTKKYPRYKGLKDWEIKRLYENV